VYARRGASCSWTCEHVLSTARVLGFSERVFSASSRPPAREIKTTTSHVRRSFMELPHIRTRRAR
jgi:hypothetical protein